MKIEGKYYYIHIVRKGETLYSISKAYNVNQIEIAMENPDIYLGLQVDQALKIPIKESQHGILGDDQDENYIYHVVRKKETLFGLSRKYEISIQDIIEANPEVEEGLKISQVVLIPKKRVQTLGSAKPEESERFIYHEVKPWRVFAISQKYGVSQSVIRRFNAGPCKDGIAWVPFCEYPDPQDTILHAGTLQPCQKPLETGEGSDRTAHVYLRYLCLQPMEDVYNIAFLLPFYQGDPKNLITEGVDRAHRKAGTLRHRYPLPKAPPFFRFLSGALLAIDSLKKEGLSINLNVYNTGKSPELTRKLLTNPGLQNANLILGPVYPECQ